MRLNKSLGMLLVSVVLVSCSTEPYKPDICTLVNVGVAQCDPVDVSKPSYDKQTKDMLGYSCLSPSDFTDGKKKLRKLIEGLETLQEPTFTRINAE